MMIHSYEPREAEAGRVLKAQGQPSLHSKFQGRQSYIDCLKIYNQKYNVLCSDTPELK